MKTSITNPSPCVLPLREPIRRPNRYERKSKSHIQRKEECTVDYRRYRKQRAGRNFPAIRPKNWFTTPWNITEPAFSKSPEGKQKDDQQEY